MAKPTIPSVLSKTEWKKNKGLITEIAKGSTGIGKALDQIKTTYDSINFTLLDALGPQSKQLKAPTEPETKALVSNVNMCLAAVNELLALAKKAQADFKASKVVLKSATTYVAELIGGAETFFDNMVKVSGG